MISNCFHSTPSSAIFSFTQLPGQGSLGFHLQALELGVAFGCMP